MRILYAPNTHRLLGKKAYTSPVSNHAPLSALFQDQDASFERQWANLSNLETIFLAQVSFMVGLICKDRVKYFLPPVQIKLKMVNY